jgi:hypothetical protein
MLAGGRAREDDDLSGQVWYLCLLHLALTMRSEFAMLQQMPCWAAVMGRRITRKGGERRCCKSDHLVDGGSFSQNRNEPKTQTTKIRVKFLADLFHVGARPTDA